MERVGCCITPHGLGHAARACAVMQALAELVPVCFEIVSTVPAWFFSESLPGISYRLHPLACDIGLVQSSPLQEDLEQTIRLLDGFFPIDETLLDQTAALFADCRLVLCDIAVLGIAAAARAGSVSVLLENFTWDWIYRGYLREYPGLEPHIIYLQQQYETADFHLQAAPFCGSKTGDVLLPPIARPGRNPRAWVRTRLQVEPDDELVLLTMGGSDSKQELLPDVSSLDQVFILPGHTAGNAMVVRDNLRLLPRETTFHHPDLVTASDAVIGKIGYSTLAEVYRAGTPYGYIRRPGFRESAPLADFVDREMTGLEISVHDFTSGNWLSLVPELCRLARSRGSGENGAWPAARFLAGLLCREPLEIRP
jgi:hypothetical protein